MTNFTLYDQVILTDKGLDNLCEKNGEDVPFPIPEGKIFTVIALHIEDSELIGFVPSGEEFSSIEIDDYDIEECEDLRSYSGIVGYKISNADHTFVVSKEEIKIVSKFMYRR